MKFFSKLSSSQKSNSEPAAFRTLLDQSMEELRLKTAAHDRLWHLAQADWSVDQDNGSIEFRAPNGMLATAPVQIIGTYNVEEGAWLWGWQHPSVLPPLQAHALQAYAYGQSHSLSRLTTRKLICSEAEAWELTALVCKLVNAQGAYRGPAGAALVFMTFGGVTLRAM